MNRRYALLLLALAVLGGIWQGSTALLALRGQGDDEPWTRPFLWEMTGALATWLCTWIPLLATRHASGAGWLRFLATHAIAFVAFDALKSTLMLGSRFALYPLLGWGEYTYGDWAAQLAMEAMKDSIVYAAIALGSGAFRMWRARQAQALREAALAAELKEARLQALLGQLNPHFLFNALNTVSSLMYRDLAATDRLLADLGAVLRAGFESDQPTWTLADERAHTERFGALLRARLGDRVRVHWDVGAGTEPLHVPRFAFQLLLENAVKHNQDRRESLDVHLAARGESGALVLTADDTGRGFGDRSPAAGAGLGLRHLEQAIALLHGPGARLERGAAPSGGARVRLVLPRNP